MQYCKTCGDYTMPTYPGGYSYYLYCPACRRNMDRDHAAWAAVHGAKSYQYGYAIDNVVADYYFDLHEDGGLNWRCGPTGAYSEEPYRTWVCDGFFAKMRDMNHYGANFQYMLDSAYNAGTNPELHSGFHIPHVSNGFTFILNISNPNISFYYNEDGNITFRRAAIFSDKQLMAKFDAGVYAYIAANNNKVKDTILKNERDQELRAFAQQAYEVEQQKRGVQYNLQTAVLLPYFLITSIIAVTMFGGGKIGLVFSTVFCITSAVANLMERNHPIKMHTFLLITLGLVNMLVGAILSL